MKTSIRKPFIGIFGKRNNGKSSLVNCLAGQEVAIVSEIAGTTTDPVKKTVEIGGIGPVVLVDTAGIDDTGILGEKRIAAARKIINTVDIALLVIVNGAFDDFELELIHQFRESDVPYLIVNNKIDLYPVDEQIIANISADFKAKVIPFSTLKPINAGVLVKEIKSAIPESVWRPATLVGDLISYGDTVLLITPIDIEAPEGRLILPQVQVIRDVLDNDGVVVVCKERELDMFFRQMQPKPKLVITDSQIFLKADASIPQEIPLTSFSIILARNKGDFEAYKKGTPKISELNDGDKVLILESCTHHVSCDDIGRMKIPRWMNNFTGKKLEFQVVAGLDSVPGKITDYALVVQCGGCMITHKQLYNRIQPAIKAGIPVTNYGMAIAYIHGIYNRAIAPFTGMEADNSDYI